MHVVFRESHGLEETAPPMDLRQTPADLVVLSFSDSDLGAFAAGWKRGRKDLPSLRLANLTALQHPLSVDTYMEKTLCGARAILVRLIGGISYWSYGIQQLQRLCTDRGIALAVLPADGRPDSRLDAVSTLPSSTLHRLAHLCDSGGAMAAQAALAQLALAAGLYVSPVVGRKTIPDLGGWAPHTGVCAPQSLCTAASARARPRIALVFYRAYLSAADTDPLAALFAAFTGRGYDVIGLFAPSLKQAEAAAWIATQLRALRPAAVVNATAFSGKGADGCSPLDATDAPVFQIALATCRGKAWAGSARGLPPADLAMNVVLPEVDGRLFAGVVSFKEPGKRDAELEYARFGHRPHSERIAAAVRKVDGWVRLRHKARADKKVACVLSTYPGRSWNMAHAVGLDPLASMAALLHDMTQAGFGTCPPPSRLATALAGARLTWPLAAYAKALALLPPPLRTALTDSWGDPAQDDAVKGDAFHFTAMRCGKAVIALQPERGMPMARQAEYHDLSRVPRHAYVAFYLWLQHGFGADAMVHMGAHGTLEWLPGKSVALSEACWPDALVRGLPVIYPFIVNDPGEAAQAKRRLGAITLGHVPPPLKQSATPDRLAHLESLLDEFSIADGLDPRRRARLQASIRSEAAALGIEHQLGLVPAVGQAEDITRIDAFVCDIKESRFAYGLHVYGRAPTTQEAFDGPAIAQAERSALLRALDGHRIAPGPSGSPYRGRRDVLPTGRNLYTIDPRALPTRAAYAQGVKLAGELLRRHLQEQGDYPRHLVVDLWGSATMRTAGEEFAMALHLLGAQPLWDPQSERVRGIEILPIALLEHPRLDVTLRISGVFRDVFPQLGVLFSQAVRALCARDESPQWNPFAGTCFAPRVYGPAPGCYGLGIQDTPHDYSHEARAQAGEAWLQSASWVPEGADLGDPALQNGAMQDTKGIRERVARADAFVHVQDMEESDLLLASDYATHEAGFAAAQSVSNGKVAVLYHLDSADPARPRVRLLKQEIARVVHARATNPQWLRGMMCHGYRGGAEIAATLEHMATFAHLAGVVGTELFEAYHDATLGNEVVADFLAAHNPQALAAMQQRFASLQAAGLWQTRRNSTAMNHGGTP